MAASQTSTSMPTEELPGNSVDGSQAKTEIGTAVGDALWIARRSGPEFTEHVRETFPIGLKGKKRGGPSVAWIKIPTSFTELMTIFENPKYEHPVWYRVPGVMDFPEFAGYYWHHNRRGHTSCHLRRMMDADQKLFHNILASACRAGKPPVCAPDYFYYSAKLKKAELKTMFQRRCMITDIPWNLEPSSGKEDNHEDWPVLGEYVQNNVRMGGFLFDAPKAWDELWFARLVMETKAGEDIPVRREIVTLVNDLKMPLTWPGRRGLLLRRKWSEEDITVIRYAAEFIWSNWRAKVEGELEC
jgi:hypothetical protein